MPRRFRVKPRFANDEIDRLWRRVQRARLRVATIEKLVRTTYVSGGDGDGSSVPGSIEGGGNGDDGQLLLELSKLKERYFALWFHTGLVVHDPPTHPEADLYPITLGFLGDQWKTLDIWLTVYQRFASRNLLVSIGERSALDEGDPRYEHDCDYINTVHIPPNRVGCVYKTTVNNPFMANWPNARTGEKFQYVEDVAPPFRNIAELWVTGCGRDDPGLMLVLLNYRNIGDDSGPGDLEDH